MSSKVHPTPSGEGGGQMQDVHMMPGVVPSDSPRPNTRDSQRSVKSILKKDGEANLSLAGAGVDLDSPASGNAASGGTPTGTPNSRQKRPVMKLVDSGEANVKNRIEESIAYKKLAQGMMLQITYADMQDLFSILDLNTDGQLDPDELKKIFKTGMEDSDVQNMLMKALAAADTDNNGYVDVEEFRQCLRLGSESNVKAIAQRMRGLAVGANDAESWVYRKNLIEYLEEKREMMENCRSLPSTLMFFVLFFFLVSSHLNLNTLNKIGTAVRGQISETTVYLENEFPDSIRSVLHSRVENGAVAEYNKIIGGIRVSKPYDFAGEPSAWWFHAPYGPLCEFGKGTYAKKLATTGGKVSIDPQKPDVCEEWAENSTAWMLWPLKESDSLAVLGGPTGKESGWPEWASGYVDHLNVDFIMKNEDIGFYTLVHIEVFVQPTGLTKSYHRVESFNSQPVWLNMKKDAENPDSIIVMILDVAFLLMFIFTAVSEIIELMGNLCREGCRAGFKEYASVWNFIDWLNIINVVIIVIIYFYCNTLVSGTNQIVDEFPEFDPSRRYNTTSFAQAVRGPNDPETCEFSPEACIQAYTTRLNHLLHQSERTLWGFWELKWFIALFAIASALRFFKAFRANPRLNVVTKTLIDSSTDLAHFMVVFATLLLAAVLVGHVLFGSRLVNFSTTAKSLNTCFLFLLCFEFDSISSQMFEHGGTLGLIWSWLFNLVMMVLLLNMILAIIFDVYSEVKSGAGSAPSLIQQTKDMWQARKDFKEKEREFKYERSIRSRKSLKQSFVGDGTGATIEHGPPNFNGEWRSWEGDIVGIFDGEQLTWPNKQETINVTINGDEVSFRHRTGKKHVGHVLGDKITWTDGDEWIRDLGDDMNARKERAEENLTSLAAALRVSQAKGKFLSSTKSKRFKEEARKKRLTTMIKNNEMWTEERLLQALTDYDLHEADVVHPGSLTEALDASQLQSEQLTEILKKAREHSEAEAAAQEISLSDSVRIIGRIDTNMRSILRSELAKASLENEKPLRSLNNRMKSVENALGGLAHRIDRLLVPTSPRQMR
eukprot:gnl/MRDRNA2_/MRDRNA2_92584_c0_seq1.p1 gnl/MRDRNA2_/MRDRNA2_92584_c0~~gnl/MRDRNA2_/MRDRNA2_92584_c0_seq1.p1  ORF type:complete len:1056 (+),score=182.50 gnl/MRDRNA2_/MRDRNA2_92584_c0_seq1:83-3250(+)